MQTDNELLVIKIGGGAGLDLERTCADIARIAERRPVVVVHGVSERMNALCREQNVPVRTLQSPSGHTSRYTDPQTRDVFVQACRDVNATICALLQQNGAAVQSLAADGDVVVHGERKAALRARVDGRTLIVRDDYSGSITDVEAAPVQAALAAGQIPVIPPMAMSDDGLLNIDGDRAAAEVAAALDAETYIILSNVRGLYRNFPDEESLVGEVPQGRISQAMTWAEGRMKRKVLGAQEALQGGVRCVVISDGRVESPVSQALAGAGTAFIHESAAVSMAG